MFALSSTIRPPLPRKLQDKGSRLTCSKFHFGGKRQACKVSASQEGAVQQEIGGLKYEHILLAILDSNPMLSSASRTALETAAGLASTHSSKLTIVFVDEEGRKLDGQRLTRVQGELRNLGIQEFECLEEEIEANVGKGSVAVGDVADQVQADLVVMSTEAVHAKHVDANLLAEFVPCPVLLLP